MLPKVAGFALPITYFTDDFESILVIFERLVQISFDSVDQADVT